MIPVANMIFDINPEFGNDCTKGSKAFAASAAVLISVI
jgi:hypothetical protein